MQTIIVDEQDKHLLEKVWYVWRRANNVYAMRSEMNAGKRKFTLLHRELLGITDSRVLVDHVNGNGLDNRRCNLRICTPSENLRNRGKTARNQTGFKGVTLHRGKYRAQIKTSYKNRWLGDFDTALEAAAAYDKAATEFHGVFAKTNGVI